MKKLSSLVEDFQEMGIVEAEKSKVKEIKNSEIVEAEEEESPLEPFNMGEEVNAWVRALLKEIDMSEDDVSDITEEDKGWRVEIAKREYLLFKSDDDAEKYAIGRVREDLESEPEIFTQSWLEGHLYMTDTDRRVIASDEADSYISDMSETDLRDYADKNGLSGEVEELESAVEGLENEVAELEGEEAEVKQKELDAKQSELEKAVGGLQELAIEHYYDVVYKALEDPVGYFVDEQGIYSNAGEMLNANIVSIDYDEAAKDAVQTDGVEHFLAGYDGKDIAVGNGVAYRVN